MNRRLFAMSLVGAVGAIGLVGCGFKLRGTFDYAFKTLYVDVNEASLVGKALIRALALENQVTLFTDPADKARAEAVLILDTEQRERAITAINSAGQVRELQLRLRVNFKLLNASGKEVIPDSQVVQQRDVSYNETEALGKESEEALLYKDLLEDVVQQLQRRLATLRSMG
jgi:LPS-assembly lipoprotein